MPQFALSILKLHLTMYQYYVSRCIKCQLYQKFLRLRSSKCDWQHKCALIDFWKIFQRSYLHNGDELESHTWPLFFNGLNLPLIGILNIFFPLKIQKKIGKKIGKKSFNVNLDTAVCVLNPETPPKNASILY